MATSPRVGQFQMSACSATTRRLRLPPAPMRIGGRGRRTGFGSQIAPLSWYHRPSKSNGSLSVHSRSTIVQLSSRALTASPVGTTGMP
jgi:hypothetical protein